MRQSFHLNLFLLVTISSFCRFSFSSISSMCLQLLRAKISKVQKAAWLDCLFCNFWDLCAQKLHIKGWWNWPLISSFYANFHVRHEYVTSTTVSPTRGNESWCCVMKLILQIITSRTTAPLPLELGWRLWDNWVWGRWGCLSLTLSLSLSVCT